MTAEQIPYARQDISDDDVAAVSAVLRSAMLSQGPMVPAFERCVATAVGARHGVAVNSATSAMHIACLALGVGPGDVVWTTPTTFVASANCAIYCGADVDFVDIDPRTLNMSPAALAEKFATAEKNGRLPKVVIPVDFTGEPADMKAIAALCRRYGAAIIEDAAHALGGQYDGAPIGSGRYADITTLSFHPVKIITTGEGGMAMTNRDDLAEKMHLLRSHGITRDATVMSQADAGGWYYEQQGLGFNYRMTDIHAALGLSQMDRLSGFIHRRHEIAARYDAGFAAMPVITPYRDPAQISGFHLYVIQLEDADRRTIYDALHAAGIAVNVHYIPVHWQPYYRARGFRRGDFPAAEAYYKKALSLPMFTRLTDAQVDRVIETLGRLL